MGPNRGSRLQVTLKGTLHELRFAVPIENVSIHAVNARYLKVHKIENFFGSEFEFYTISLLVMLKY